MKKLFSLNITGIDKEQLDSSEFNETDNIDGHELLVAEASDAIMEEGMNCAMELEKKVTELKSNKLLGNLFVIFKILLFVTFIAVLALFETFNPIVILITLGLSILDIVIYGVAKHLGKKLDKEISESETVNMLTRRLDASIERMYEELDFPSDGDLVDLMIAQYVIKNGKIALKSVGHSNVSAKVARIGDNLSFALVGRRYDIPISNIKNIEEVKKRFMFIGWNKDEEYNSKEMKKYKITRNNYGWYFVKPYYSIVFDLAGEDCELVIMPYDIDVIRNLIENTVDD